MNSNKTHALQSVLNEFKSVTLNELDKVKLLNRQDTKFVYNQRQLPLLLDKIKSF